MSSPPNASIAVAERAAANPNASVKLKVDKLDFYYGEKRALKGINLDMVDRQVTAMIGPSGCGKSTLLRVLNRMYDLYPGQRAEGKVLLDGQNVIGKEIDPAVLRARIGMVFQKANAIPDVDLRQHRLRREAA
jgi:phosphate transport system ATP-binding protein